MKRGTENPEAFEHYLRGRYYFNTFTEESFAKAFVHFHSAISADPDYAHAYSGVADYYNWLGILGVLPPNECFVPATEAAKKAVELDENLSEGHASLGFALHAGNFEWSRAEQHLMKAIELNPSNANAYVWYSIVLYTEGRFAEGIQFANRSIELDPLTPFNHHNLAWGLYYARRFDEASSAYRKVISDFPTYSFGYYGLSKVLRIQGEAKDAISANDRAMELMGGSIFSRLAEAECYAADGQRDTAYKMIAALESESDGRYVSPYQLALSYCHLGEPDKAIELLQKAQELKDPWLNWLGVEPAFDRIRGEARFESILETVGYRPFFNSFSSVAPAAGAKVRDEGLHNLTTLVIDDVDTTSEGIGDVTARRFNWVAYLAAAMIVGLAGFGIWMYVKAPGAERPTVAAARVQTPGLVVVPFTSDSPEDAAVGVGLADALSNKLGNIKTLKVISANTGRSLAGTDLSALSERFGISYVLKGSIRRNGVNASILAELLDTRQGSVVFREEFTADGPNLFVLQTRVAEKVWTSLGIEPLPLERQQVERSYTQSPAAYDLYLRGRSEMANRSVESLNAAAETFARSLSEDSGFALAYVGLSDALALLKLYSVSPPENAYEQAKRNLARALEIDPNLAEAHATLAYIKFFHDRDRAGSELEFRRSIQVNPSYAPAHHWFALTLAAKGDRLDAETEIEIAKRLDPSAAAIRSAAAVVYFHLGNLERAIEEGDAAIAIDSRAIPAYKVKRWAFTAMGRQPEAEAALMKEMELSGGSITDPGWQVIKAQVDAISGSRDEILKTLNFAVQHPSVGGNHFGYAYELALAYNALGEPKSALEWLERAETSQNHSFNYLTADPRFSNLRNESKFLALAEKLTLTSQ